MMGLKLGEKHPSIQPKRRMTTATYRQSESGYDDNKKSLHLFLLREISENNAELSTRLAGLPPPLRGLDVV